MDINHQGLCCPSPGCGLPAPHPKAWPGGGAHWLFLFIFFCLLELFYMEKLCLLVLMGKRLSNSHHSHKTQLTATGGGRGVLLFSSYDQKKILRCLKYGVKRDLNHRKVTLVNCLFLSDHRRQRTSYKSCRRGDALNQLSQQTCPIWPFSVLQIGTLVHFYPVCITLTSKSEWSNASY